MVSSDTYLVLAYIIFVILLGVGVSFFFSWRSIRRRDEMWRSLNLRLLRISLPRPDVPDAGFTLEQIRERIGTMEKVYASLEGIRDSAWRTLIHGRPSFSLELTVPHVGEEIKFYVAVPRRLAPAVEKIIEGVFPDAKVEATEDYNIFNPTGESVGARIELEGHSFLPVRTYRELESDPLKELANAFTKLARVGEGASLQIVARPASRDWGRRIVHHAKLAYLGKRPVLPRNVVHQGVVAIHEATKSEPRNQDGELHRQNEQRLSPQEEEQIKKIEGKGSKPLFESNIRIIASAETGTRAEGILASIAAAFLQFRAPGLNGFVVREIAKSSLPDFFYRFSFRVFDSSVTSILSSEELTSIFHLPNVPIEAPKLAVVKSREAPPPVNLPESGILLGVSVFRGEQREVRITEDDRRRHLYVIGQTGTGKTAYMKELIRQDILAGRGVCFIDPHGDAVEEILGYVPEERARDVIYFNPGDTERPMGLNMLEYDSRYPEQKTLVVNELFSIFQKLYGAVPEALGPMFEQYFRNSTLLVMDDPASGNTMLEIERVFADKAFRDLKLSRSTNVVVKSFWRDIAEKAGGEASLANMVPYITSKFDNFLANEIMRPIIAQEKSAFNFRDIMDSRKIFLINLSKGRLGELNSSLIGLVMVGKLLLAAFSRTDVAEEARPDFYVYIDEFQNVTTKSIATILSEARKYRLDLTIAHQFLGQLEDEIKKAVFGNVGSITAFRIGSDDAEFMAQQFSPVFNAQDLLNIDNYNALMKLLIKGQTSQPFNMKTVPPGPRNQEMAERLKALSRLAYGRPKSEVDAEINARYEKSPRDPLVSGV